jgi:plasmid stability protein
MPTLYVENVPKDLYEALRDLARKHRKSISAEVLTLLQQTLVTPAEQSARKQFLRQAQRMRSQSGGSGHFSAAEEMQREDRLR